MKKIISLILLGLLLSSCSGGLPDIASLLATPTLPPPLDTPTPQPTVTLIPTRDLFALPSATPVTFTPTETSLIPDLIQTAIPPTGTPLPLPTYSNEFINDVAANTFFVQNVGFRGILYSDAILYWNEGPCTTRSIKITAFVEDPARTDRVFLFLRLRDKKNTLNVGEWSSGAEMIKIEDGSFNYKVETHNLRRYYFYKEAWIEYQLVAVNENLEILGRTQLYDKNLSLIMCKSFSSP
jgi:hypothetical protein